MPAARQRGECLRVGAGGVGLDHRVPPLLRGQLREQAAGNNRVGERLGADLFDTDAQRGDVVHDVGARPARGEGALGDVPAAEQRFAHRHRVESGRGVRASAGLLGRDRVEVIFLCLRDRSAGALQQVVVGSGAHRPHQRLGHGHVRRFGHDRLTRRGRKPGFEEPGDDGGAQVAALHGVTRERCGDLNSRGGERGD